MVQFDCGWNDEKDGKMTVVAVKPAENGSCVSIQYNDTLDWPTMTALLALPECSWNWDFSFSSWAEMKQTSKKQLRDIKNTFGVKVISLWPVSLHSNSGNVVSLLFCSKLTNDLCMNLYLYPIFSLAFWISFTLSMLPLYPLLLTFLSLSLPSLFCDSSDSCSVDTSHTHTHTNTYVVVDKDTSQQERGDRSRRQFVSYPLPRLHPRSRLTVTIFTSISIYNSENF